MHVQWDEENKCVVVEALVFTLDFSSFDRDWAFFVNLSMTERFRVSRVLYSAQGH